MNANDVGPLQLLVIGFGPDAAFEGLVLDELERLTARGLIRVIDLRFVTKDSDGSVEAIELADLESDEVAEYGSVIDTLIGLRERSSGELAVADDSEEQSFGLGPDELAALARELRPGEAVGLLLFEHTWAAELKAAIRATGGFPIAQGLLTPEAMLMVGAEVQAIAEAEAAIELADAINGAAMLDAMAAVAAAEDIKTAAAVDAVQALIVAGLIADAAAEEALEALLAAELVEEAVIEAAAEESARANQETDEAFGAFVPTESES